MRGFWFGLFAASIAVGSLVREAQASSVRPMGEIAAGTANTNDVTDWGRGYRFTVETDDVWVTELGYLTPGLGSYSLALWDDATETKIASVSGLGGTASETDWAFSNVTPVALTKGASYSVTLYATGTAQYFFTNDPAFRPSGDIDYVTMAYCGSCSETTYPSAFLNNYNYGFADIGYQIGTPMPPVPLPAGAVLMISAVGAFAVGRRRKAPMQS